MIFLELWQEAKNPPKIRGRKKREADEATQEEWNARRAAKFVAEGQYSRASQSLLSQGIAPITTENIETMREKHKSITTLRRGDLRSVTS